MSDARKKNPLPSETNVPKAVVGRLSLYLRELQRLIRDGQETTSSTQVGTLLGFTDAQVRKDLAYFGQFGYPGVGYRCRELVDEIRRILGTDRDWPVVLVGVGNLGRALIGYKGFGQQGFRLVAALDVDHQKVGRQIGGIDVHHLDEAKDVIQRHGIKLALVTVPAEAAQTVADRLAEVGIDGILNFAPVTLTLPGGVSAQAVDLAMELEQLSFGVLQKSEKPADE